MLAQMVMLSNASPSIQAMACSMYIIIVVQSLAPGTIDKCRSDRQRTDHGAGNAVCLANGCDHHHCPPLHCCTFARYLLVSPSLPRSREGVMNFITTSCLGFHDRDFRTDAVWVVEPTSRSRTAPATNLARCSCCLRTRARTRCLPRSGGI